MRPHRYAVAVALICMGVVTACERTTPGTVAMTTEPGPPLPSATSRPTASPPTRRVPTTPAVPAPANATTMTCDEFTGLDKPTRVAVVHAILSGDNSIFGPMGDEFAETMANTMCQFMPDSTVKEVLTGSPPP